MGESNYPATWTDHPNENDAFSRAKTVQGGTQVCEWRTCDQKKDVLQRGEPRGPDDTDNQERGLILPEERHRRLRHRYGAIKANDAVRSDRRDVPLLKVVRRGRYFNSTSGYERGWDSQRLGRRHQVEHGQRWVL